MEPRQWPRDGDRETCGTTSRGIRAAGQRHQVGERKRRRRRERFLSFGGVLLGQGGYGIDRRDRRIFRRRPPHDPKLSRDNSRGDRRGQRIDMHFEHTDECRTSAMHPATNIVCLHTDVDQVAR